MVIVIKNGVIQNDRSFTCKDCKKKYSSLKHLQKTYSNSGNHYDQVNICRSCYQKFLKEK